jgi:hypothetical protein
MNMATNRERIESLEADVYDVKEGIQHLEERATSFADRMQRIEALNEISTLLSMQHGLVGRQPYCTYEQGGPSRGFHQVGATGQQVVLPRYAKIEFSRYQGDDPTEWFNCVVQFFYYHGTPPEQKVVLASFHLEGEANQWW